MSTVKVEIRRYSSQYSARLSALFYVPLYKIYTICCMHWYGLQMKWDCKNHFITQHPFVTVYERLPGNGHSLLAGEQQRLLV
jgi:hypothetical protein